MGQWDYKIDQPMPGPFPFPNSRKGPGIEVVFIRYKVNKHFTACYARQNHQNSKTRYLMDRKVRCKFYNSTKLFRTCHFSVLSPFQRFIPISAFYPHFSFRFQFPFPPFSFSVLSRPCQGAYIYNDFESIHIC